MAANVESMFSVRETPWHGLGVIVQEALNSVEALKLAGLDWSVRPEPTYIHVNGQSVVIPNTFANTRDSDNSVLGVVTGRYKIVQNIDAFNFTDALLGKDVQYETAGALDKGRKVWLLARMPETEILGDKIEQYLCFTNSHDGKGSIKVMATPVRVVCQNTLNIAVKGANRKWKTKHLGDMNTKLAEAHRTLEMASKYQEALKDTAFELSKKKVSFPMFSQFVQNMFPMEDDMTKRQKQNVQLLRDDLNLRYMEAPDLGNHRGNAWGVINAISDFSIHHAPLRSSADYKENRFNDFLDESSLMDRAMELLSI